MAHNLCGGGALHREHALSRARLVPAIDDRTLEILQAVDTADRDVEIGVAKHPGNLAQHGRVAIARRREEIAIDIGPDGDAAKQYIEIVQFEPLGAPLMTTCPPKARPFGEKLDALSRHNLQSLNLAFLAERLALSPRTLARRFSEELHTSPGRWIQDRRLKTARELLEGTKLSISEICYRAGYQDVASFSRLFAEMTGLPPGEYRRQSQ